MTNIFLKINGTSIVSSASDKITSGMVGLPVNIEYDESWVGLTKTVFFRVGNQVRKRDDVSTSTTVPWEILRNHGKTLEIGVEGRDTDGNIVMPTVWASVATVYQGASGNIPAAPNPNDVGNGGSTTDVVIDPTLSIEGAAADAKAVGDIIGDIETALDAIIAIQEGLIHGKTITFTIVGVSECTAKEGMTWGEWVESEYNTIGCTVDENFALDCVIWNGFGILYEDYTSVHLNDVIIADYNYVY